LASMHRFVRYRLFDRISSYFPRRPGLPCRDSTSRLSAFTPQEFRTSSDLS